MVDVSGLSGDPSPSRSRSKFDFSDVYDRVISAVKTWREGGDADGDIAVEVSRVDLMAPDAILSPQRWLASRAELSESDKADLLQKIGTAQEKWASAALAPAEPPAPVAASVSQMDVPLRSLKEIGAVIVRGAYTKPNRTAEEHPVKTVRVVTLETLRTGSPVDLPAPADRGHKPAALSQAGDVMVSAIGTRINAYVCQEEGLEVDRNVSSVRSLGPNWDPDYMAYQLTADHNQSMLHGATIKRAEVKELLVPQQPLAVQAEIGRAFRQFTAFAESARAVASDAEEYLHALREGVATGAVTIASSRSEKHQQ